MTYAPASLEPKYGCVSFREVLEPAADEDVYVGYARFRDRAHHDEVMAKIDVDEQLTPLYRQVGELLDLNRVVRGEFELAA